MFGAHPDFSQPEQVQYKNFAKNKSLTGAPFHHIRNLLGPALQMSSSAAEQLHMLEVAPIQIQVAALQRKSDRQVPPSVAEDPTIADTSATDTTDTLEKSATRNGDKRKSLAPDEITEAPLDLIAGATGAIEASETSTPAGLVAATTATTPVGW